MTEANQDSMVRRSSGVLRHRRAPLEWPGDKDFRILSIDGGGIRGIFSASVLAGLEEHYLGGSSIAPYFDLITGTSTGGIIAIGLGAGLTATELRDIYLERGREIFPPMGLTPRWLRLFRYRYNREPLVRILSEYLGDQTLQESQSRMCIPSCEGRFSDLYVFKTPHHPDYRLDGTEKMVKVATATSAAPTYFKPLDDGGYTFLDGGIWANNPIMVGLTEALTAFAVPRERVRILSIGCGNRPHTVGSWKRWFGGMLAWRDIIDAALRFQSLGAIGQAGLLIGRDRILRVDLPETARHIELDDWLQAHTILPAAAGEALVQSAEEVAALFLQDRTDTYQPIQPGVRTAGS